MSFSSPVANATRPTEGLGQEMERLLNRLSELSRRIESLGERTVGPEPRPAGLEGVDPPVQNLARAVDRAHGIVSRIDNEVERISARL